MFNDVVVLLGPTVAAYFRGILDHHRSLRKSAVVKTIFLPSLGMSTPAQRRLLRDLMRMQSDSPPGIGGAPVNDNVMVWNAVIFGPEDTVFQDGTFKLRLDFSEEYPNKPPRVVFVSKIFHPNVYTDGSICLDILSSAWCPTYDVVSILMSIQSLLNDPNPNSPANSVAAQLFMENKREYDKRVRACVEETILDDDDDL